MEKEMMKVESSGVLSMVLSPDETQEVRELSEKLGISISHLGRALVRLALTSISGVHDGAKDEMMLRLIKLGK
jgi:hypothetical protein